MPDGIVIRPYAAGDETGVLVAWNDAMWADPIDALSWRTRYLLDPTFDPRACLVAEDSASQRIIGFVLGICALDGTTREPTGTTAWVVAFGVVANCRRRGIGRALFDQLNEFWVGSGVSRVVVGPWIPHYVTPGIDEQAYADAIAFLRARGGAVASRPLSMKASLTGYRSAPSVGERAERLSAQGITIRMATAADILPLLRFLDEHFPHWRPDAAGVLQELFGADPRQVTMHVAEERGVIIGYAQSKAERFGPFGVNEAYRGRGIGAVLLASALHAMRAKGYHCALFLWTSDRAARLYQEHGFAEARRFALMDYTIGDMGEPSQ